MKMNNPLLFPFTCGCVHIQIVAMQSGLYGQISLLLSCLSVKVQSCCLFGKRRTHFSAVIFGITVQDRDQFHQFVFLFFFWLSWIFLLDFRATGGRRRLRLYFCHRSCAASQGEKIETIILMLRLPFKSYGATFSVCSSFCASVCPLLFPSLPGFSTGFEGAPSNHKPQHLLSTRG